MRKISSPNHRQKTPSYAILSLVLYSPALGIGPTKFPLRATKEKARLQGNTKSISPYSKTRFSLYSPTLICKPSSCIFLVVNIEFGRVQTCLEPPTFPIFVSFHWLLNRNTHQSISEQILQEQVRENENAPKT